MRKLLLCLIAVLAVVPVMSQGGPTTTKTRSDKIAAPATPLDMAKAALEAHGGDKFKKMRSLVVKGSVDVNVFGQSVPGAFSTVFSGSKYYFEINSIAQQLKQVYDGRETYSSLEGFALPPVTTVGFPVLARVGDAGFTVSPLPATSKKKRGFRITSPEGFYTDFSVDEKTGRVKGYDSAFEVSGGRVVTTSAEIDEVMMVEGVLVPKKYAQRFDLGTLTAYATFKAKEILVNSAIEESFFTLPR
jgi:hypothetical protein